MSKKHGKKVFYKIVKTFGPEVDDVSYLSYISGKFYSPWQEYTLSIVFGKNMVSDRTTQEAGKDKYDICWPTQINRGIHVYLNRKDAVAAMEKMYIERPENFNREGKNNRGFVKPKLAFIRVEANQKDLVSCGNDSFTNKENGVVFMKVFVPKQTPKSV